jgi:hypothetical protein
MLSSETDADHILTAWKNPFLASTSGKVYFIERSYESELLADPSVRWDVAAEAEP